MPDPLIAAAAALLFAVWLRLHFYVLLRDGLALAAVAYALYLFVAYL